MNKLIQILIVFVLYTCAVQAQSVFDKVFKYSTIYTSFSGGTSLVPESKYFVRQDGTVVNITPEATPDYRFTIGIRKIARFSYEKKVTQFYDGSEHNVSLSSNIGAVNGVEFLLQYDEGQQQLRDYKNQRYFVRYLGNHWLGRIEYQQNGLIDLKYTQVELRGRLKVGARLNLSLGTAYRTHRPYGFNPIEQYLTNKFWWDLAYDYGYADHAYSVDLDGDFVVDEVNWYWTNPQGDRVADSDLDFRSHVYESIVNDYNRSEFNKIGDMGTVSVIAGLDFYHYSPKFWLHSWASLLPYHWHVQGDENFSYLDFNDNKQWFDYNIGVIVGVRLNKSFGIFAESEWLKYWDRNLNTFNIGLNYQFR